METTAVSSRSVVILLSGGLDSAANLALSAEAGDRILALNIDYGQRAARPERRASRALANYYGAEFKPIDLPFVGALGGSSLTDSMADVPTLARDQLDDLSVITGTAKSVWVPNRNGIFIAAAAAYAEREGADTVLVGFNREEATTFPDNSTEFLEATTKALYYSTANHVTVRSHTDRLDKREIVRELRALKRKSFPFELVWSCYHAGAEPCGKCESCQRFSRAVSAE